MAVPVYQASGSGQANLGNITCAWPTPHQADDIGLLVVQTANQTVTTPTDWTFIATQGIGTAGAAGSVAITVFYKRATSSAEASVTIADTGDHQLGKIHLIRGCITTGNPYDILTGDTGASSTSVSIPGGTTSVAEVLWVAIVGHATDIASGNDQFSAPVNASLTAVTLQVGLERTTGTGGGWGIASGTKATAGVVSATTGTLATASAQARIGIGFRPPQPAASFTGNGGPSVTLSTTAPGVASMTPGSTTQWFVKNGGNDALDGHSDANAWATIAKVNATLFPGGSSIFFKKGSVWREKLTIPTSGASGLGISYGAYGTGAKPKLLASEAPSSWTLHAANIYKATLALDPATFSGFRGNLFFEALDGTTVTVAHNKKALIANLAAEFDWTYLSGQVYVFAATSPATRYLSVECCQRGICIQMAAKDYITIDGLDCRYASDVLIDGGNHPEGGHTDFTLSNCDLGWQGTPGEDGYAVNSQYSNTWIHHNTVHDIARRAITCTLTGVDYGVVTGWLAEYNTLYNNNHSGFDFKVNITRISGAIIRYNTLYETTTKVFTTYNGDIPTFGGFDISGSGSTTAYILDLSVHHNTIYNFSLFGMRFEACNGLTVYNNTIVGPHPTNPGSFTYCITVGPSVVGTVSIRNNILQSTGDYCLFTNAKSQITVFDYNLFYTAAGATKILGDSASGNSYTSGQFAAYKTFTGFDTHSPTPADPKFTDTVNADYTLQATSPAVNAGIAITGITDGFSGSAPDLGTNESTVGNTFTGTGAPSATLTITAAGVATMAQEGIPPQPETTFVIPFQGTGMGVKGCRIRFDWVNDQGEPL